MRIERRRVACRARALRPDHRCAAAGAGEGADHAKRLGRAVLLSDMVDNSDLPFEREVYLFSDGFSTGDVPRRALRSILTPPRRYGEPAGLLFPTLRQRPSAGAVGAMPADHGPSTADSSGQRPSPAIAGARAAPGAFHQGRWGGPTLAGATHAAARSDSRPATTPDGVEAAAPPASSTRSGASAPPPSAAASNSRARQMRY
jgi:hypothetical protein